MISSALVPPIKTEPMHFHFESKKQKRTWIPHRVAVPLLVGAFSLTAHADVTVTFTEDDAGVTASYTGSVGFAPSAYEVIPDINDIDPNRYVETDVGPGGPSGSFYSSPDEQLLAVSRLPFSFDWGGFFADTPTERFFPAFGAIGAPPTRGIPSGDTFGFDERIYVGPYYEAGDPINGLLFFPSASFQ
ncbi:hypothetical protein N8529_00775, partial [bacterium]|nr:hypothetical protein [bacterium]